MVLLFVVHTNFSDLNNIPLASTNFSKLLKVAKAN